jgi:FixJ family two-component response regulator
MRQMMTKSTPKHAAASTSISLHDIEKVLGLAVDIASDRYSHLTPRETQVSDMMATGKPNREIATELGISVKTLDIHRANLMHKLQARTTADVANLVNLLRLAEVAAVRAG